MVNLDTKLKMSFMFKHIFYMTVLFAILVGCNKQSKNSGLIDVPSSLFTYTAEGNGIPCVIFTGSENVGHNMLPKELQEHFTFIHADPSSIEASKVSDITLNDILNDLEKLRIALQLDKIAILGHSMFGRLPLEYAVKYPNNISYAISTGSVPFSTEVTDHAKIEYWESEASKERKSILKRNWERLEGTDWKSLSPTQQFIKSYIADTPKWFCDPNFEQTAMWEGVEINMRFLFHYGGTLMKDLDHTELYKNIRCPVLVFSGKCDFGAPYFLWEDIRDKNIMPNLHLIVYDDAGHNPFFEVPEKFTNDLMDWVQKNNKMKGGE